MRQVGQMVFIAGDGMAQRLHRHGIFICQAFDAALDADKGQIIGMLVIKPEHLCTHGPLAQTHCFLSQIFELVLQEFDVGSNATKAIDQIDLLILHLALSC